MLDHVHILTLTHRMTKLKSIGELVAAFEANDGLTTRLRALRTKGMVKEIYYAATCNRLLLLFTTDLTVDESFRADLLDGAHQRVLLQLRHLRGLEAVKHLFEVSASIDSLVIGERQILGQLRDSYERCRRWGVVGDDLRIVVNQAVLAAKDVYANTRIGEKSVSIVSLAIQRLRAFSPSRQSKIVLVGAGQTNMLVAKFLRKDGYHNVTVVNRTLARAEQLAATFEAGRAGTQEQLPTLGQNFDVLFICTSAPEPILTPNLFATLLNGTPAREKIVIDLGVPADVAEQTVATHDFRYVDIERLRQLADENLAFRRQEIDRANEILNKHVDELEVTYRQRLLERAMADLPAEIKNIRHVAVNQIFRKEVEALDPETRDLMHRMMSYMEKRCIGIPMKAAREAILS